MRRTARLRRQFREVGQRPRPPLKIASVARLLHRDAEDTLALVSLRTVEVGAPSS